VVNKKNTTASFDRELAIGQEFLASLQKACLTRRQVAARHGGASPERAYMGCRLKKEPCLSPILGTGGVCFLSL